MLRASLTWTVVTPGALPTITTRCEAWSTSTDAMDGSRTTAAIGLIADPTVTFTALPTPTVALAGAIESGGGVGANEGAAVGETDGAGEAGGTLVGDGAGLGSGSAASRAAQAANGSAARKGAALGNLRCFGVVHRRGQQRLVTDARKEHRHEVAFGALDGAGSELGMRHDVGDLEAAGRGLCTAPHADRTQAVAARAAVVLVEVFTEIVEDEAAPARSR